MTMVEVVTRDSPVTPGSNSTLASPQRPAQARNQVLAFVAGLPWKGTLGMCVCAPLDRTLVAWDHCLIIVSVDLAEGNE
jgi:hypothetical protein